MANNKFMRIRIPLDPPANEKKIKVQKIKDNDDVEEIQPSPPPGGEELLKVNATFVWRKKNPNCVTFEIFGKQFTV
jgi:hypothetical protein